MKTLLVSVYKSSSVVVSEQDVANALEVDFEDRFMPLMGGAVSMYSFIDLVKDPVLSLVKYEKDTFVVLFSYDEQKSTPKFRGEYTAVTLSNAVKATCMLPFGLTENMVGFNVTEDVEKCERLIGPFLASTNELEDSNGRRSVSSEGIPIFLFSLDVLVHQRIKQKYRKRHQQEKQRFCDSAASATTASSAAAVPNSGGGGRHFVAKHTYGDDIMDFVTLVFNKSSFRADAGVAAPRGNATLSRKINCINPDHSDKKPSMKISLIPRFWELSEKVTVDENTARILDTIVGVDRSDNVREGKEYTSISDNVVLIGDKMFVLYIFSVYCFACGYSGMLATP